MKISSKTKVALYISVIMVSLISIGVAYYAKAAQHSPSIATSVSPTTPKFPIPIVAELDSPRIQLALLLDTSSSMSGLLNQARSQLWTVVNEFSTAEKDGKKTSSRSGYIRIWKFPPIS